MRRPAKPYFQVASTSLQLTTTSQPGDEPIRCGVSTRSRIILEPLRPTLVSCRLLHPVLDGTHVFIEGFTTRTYYMVGRSLNITTDNRVYVEITNTTSRRFRLPAEKLIAKALSLPRHYQEHSLHPAGSLDPKVRENDSAPQDSATTFPDPSTPVVAAVKKEEDKEPDEMVIDFEGSSLSTDQQELIRTLLLKYRDIFVTSSKNPGQTDLVECEIDTGSAKPFKLQPYRVSQKEGEAMEAEIAQYLRLGLIRESTSPWASPVLMIRKPDGSIRFCIDYRRLNSVTIKDSYPMPRVDDLLDVLGRAKIFSTMDVASGYWNVKMARKSIEKTAFTCKYGLYEWLVMPFGLCNAVPIFERLMEHVLRDYKWRTCLVYLDDVIVFSEDFAEHLVRLGQVLSCFRKAGFKLKMSKCHWGRARVAFLGHMVTPSGILPNPEKVKAVLKIQSLKNVAEVRAFLGLVGYFRRFIKGFAEISKPIEKLKTDDVFRWTEECNTALDTLKRKLAKPPILAYPDFSPEAAEFVLYTDACPIAIGAILMQKQGKHERVLAYASQALNQSQAKWIDKKNGTSEIECYGVVWALNKFRPYLDRRPFTLVTDHHALVWLFDEAARSGKREAIKMGGANPELPVQDTTPTRRKDWSCRRFISATRKRDYGDGRSVQARTRSRGAWARLGKAPQSSRKPGRRVGRTQRRNAKCQQNHKRLAIEGTSRG